MMYWSIRNHWPRIKRLLVEGLLSRCLYKVRRCMPFFCGWYSEVERKENGFQGDWWVTFAFTVSFLIKYWRIEHLIQKKEENETVLIVPALSSPNFWSIGKCLVFFLSQGQFSAVCSLLIMVPSCVLAGLWSLTLPIPTSMNRTNHHFKVCLPMQSANIY